MREIFILEFPINTGAFRENASVRTSHLAVPQAGLAIVPSYMYTLLGASQFAY